MMYFTESDDSCVSPLELNEEFEAKYDTAEYEPKISRLLHEAHKRLKDENLKNRAIGILLYACFAKATTTF